MFGCSLSALTTCSKPGGVVSRAVGLVCGVINSCRAHKKTGNPGEGFPVRVSVDLTRCRVGTPGRVFCASGEFSLLRVPASTRGKRASRHLFESIAAQIDRHLAPALVRHHLTVPDSKYSVRSRPSEGN